MAASKGILITIIGTEGSTPRNQGAWAWVSDRAIIGSIGGGRMEADAIARARDMLTSPSPPKDVTVLLGPSIGQCCGGKVLLRFEEAPPPQAHTADLVIFGAGHIGSKLAKMALAVPFAVSLIDNRSHIEMEDGADYEHHAQPETLIATLAPKSHVIVLTHDHGLDFRITEAALLRDDLGFIGMIGSSSKAAQFRSAFRALGPRLERLHAPIAKSGRDKRPASIALAVLSEIMQYQEQFTTQPHRDAPPPLI